MRGRVWQTWQLYLAVKAGLPLPDDAVTVRNVALLRWAEERVASDRAAGVPVLLRAALMRR